MGGVILFCLVKWFPKFPIIIACFLDYFSIINSTDCCTCRYSFIIGKFSLFILNITHFTLQQAIYYHIFN